MAWLKSPSLRAKPPHPLPTLPRPKNMFVAVLLVLVPTLVMLGFGILFAWLGILASSGLSGWLNALPRHPAFLAALLFTSALSGAMIGLQSLVRIMHYVSLDKKGLVVDDEKPSSLWSS
ncbi:hypothetical protein KJZ71_05545 [Patescibacteria group bacterium]|uniref:Uncharacterized protein n=1 Tax=candidate division WWE3 bacterium TaxID=2053526 RepID=A0A928TPT4_UNCKA|nr:hypothetical protein [candidate division WWE3 bacterium]MCL4733232.1 hypothetical protein [Patescibacteria group bacterium]MDL1953308.1 hypothetical protein [Candidatus Uhrbacteria bacterium UHB]RIL00537.1 MAG: hypothetical protein DCC77_03180 [Candidatus Uhrbacteria bacterium]